MISLKPYTCQVVKLGLNPGLIDFKDKVIFTLLCQLPLTIENCKQNQFCLGHFHMNRTFLHGSLFDSKMA